MAISASSTFAGGLNDLYANAMSSDPSGVQMMMSSDGTGFTVFNSADSNSAGWHQVMDSGGYTLTNATNETRWKEIRTIKASAGLDLDPMWKEMSDRMKNIEEHIKDPCAYCGRDFEPDPKYPGECIRCGGPRIFSLEKEELRELAKAVREDLAEMKKLKEQPEPVAPPSYAGYGNWNTNVAYATSTAMPTMEFSTGA
jgi:hypothetical protein